MSGSVNRAIILGHLGRDPEVRSFSNGGKVANLSVATSESWKDKSGERQERTEWHRVAIMDERLVGIAEKYLKKGSKVYLEGQIETRKWTDQKGDEKYTTEIVLRPFRSTLTLLDSPNGGLRGDNDREERPARRETPPPTRGRDTSRRHNPLDDDIPFAPQVD